MITFTNNPITELREGMSFADYCDFPGLNQSRLKDFDYELEGCPKLFLHRCENPDERRDSSALSTGRRYHHFLLEPSSFAQHYAVITPEIEAQLFDAALANGSRAKGFSKALSTYDAWEKEQVSAGREVVSVNEAAQLEQMRQAVLGDPVVMSALGFGAARTEVSAFCPYQFNQHTDFAGKQFQLKARFDLVPGDDALIDLKTARTAEPRKFALQVQNLGYFIQAAFYVDAARKNKLPIKRFGFLAQDKFPPYLPCIHWMPDDWLKYGLIQYQRILLGIAGCITSNKWPARRSGILEPPRYAQEEIEAAA